MTCAVSGFSGTESQILRLRNTNRDTPETLAYLAWRYEVEPDCPPPRIYWLLTPDQERIGMASAIFRSYQIAGTRTPVAVIGDISLDERWRRRGLGQKLLRFMTDHLAQSYPQYPSLVIPTPSAQRSLARVGWISGGQLAPLVCVLDPSRRLPRFVGGALPAAASRVTRAAVRLLSRSHIPRDCTLEVSATLSATLRARLPHFPPSGRISRTLDAPTLDWRYVRHPHARFKFATFARAGRPRAFLVFEESQSEGTCFLYDMAAEDTSSLRGLLALFVRRGAETPALRTLRVLLDTKHSARVVLRQVGFIARAPEAAFQLFAAASQDPPRGWCLTQGDKDT